MSPPNPSPKPQKNRRKRCHDVNRVICILKEAVGELWKKLGKGQRNQTCETIERSGFERCVPPELVIDPSDRVNTIRLRRKQSKFGERVRQKAPEQGKSTAMSNRKAHWTVILPSLVRSPLHMLSGVY
jgi:hypothetical protein